jgi:hypothetical protein
MITAEFLGYRELGARLDAVPGRVHDGLARAVTRLGLELQRRVQEKLSGDVLELRSGSLRSSVNIRIDNDATSVSASVGTDVFEEGLRAAVADAIGEGR